MNAANQTQSRSRKLFTLIANIGVKPTDDIDQRLQKSLLVVCAIPFAIAGLVWGVMYYALGLPVSAAIPFSYGVFSMLSIANFNRTKEFRIFRFTQLLLILLLPFFLMVTLGGFINGSAVIVWSLICPIGALLFESPKRALWWFFAYVVLMAISGILQPYFEPNYHLSQNMIILFFALNLGTVSGLVFMLVYYFVHQKNIYQDQSESLLLNILPKAIADELKKDHHTIAEHYEGASIMFADLVNFTPMSADMNPDELVNLLNEVFSEFDAIVESYGLEKIKTIGDCYMVAAGVPARRSDHAQILTRLALEFQECVDSRNFAGQKLQFRIGINSGPVVAGVIGRKKFIYDLWGDAVNMASRMESHGVGGFIQVTGETRELIKEDFECELRGTIELKGKGATKTWFVTGIRNI